MKTQIITALSILCLTILSSCKKEDVTIPPEPSTEPTNTENTCDPNTYFDCILHDWEVDSSTYWTGNHPSYNDTILHFTSSTASYSFDYDIPTDDRTILYDSGTLIDGTAFGFHSFPTVNNPTHLHMSIYSGKDVYIQYMSNERLEWVEYDPTGNGYTDSLYVYLHR